MSDDVNTSALEEEFTGQEDNETVELAKDFTDEPRNMSLDVPVPVLQLNVKKLPHYEGLPDLKQATIGSAGVDLYSAQVEDYLLLNSIGATVMVPTGISIELPLGFEAQIRPRSGLAANFGLTVLNSPGTIDSDYRGEITVILTKLTTGKFKVERGMRIAQMVIAPVIVPTITYVEDLSDTDRGAGGFGHTGT